MIKLFSWKEESVSVTLKKMLLVLIISVLIEFIAVLMWFSKRLFLLIKTKKSLIGQSGFIFAQKESFNHKRYSTFRFSSWPNRLMICRGHKIDEALPSKDVYYMEVQNQKGFQSWMKISHYFVSPLQMQSYFGRLNIFSKSLWIIVNTKQVKTVRPT